MFQHQKIKNIIMNKLVSLIKQKHFSQRIMLSSATTTEQSSIRARARVCHLNATLRKVPGYCTCTLIDISVPPYA